MKTLSDELKGVIGRRLELAQPQEVFAIVSALHSVDEVRALKPAPAQRAQVMPESRFDVREHVVVDRATGLTWAREHVSTKKLGWQKAREACEALDLDGFRDWRMPSVKELLTLVDYERHSPAIDTAAFPNCKSDWYWSSTPAASSPGDYAWFVAFDGGDSFWNHQDDEAFVRAVRASQ